MKILWHENAWNDYYGWWSRRIDDTNRIVYKQDGDNIIIAACKGHYH